jgi:hypothetical protein
LRQKKAFLRGFLPSFAPFANLKKQNMLKDGHFDYFVIIGANLRQAKLQSAKNNGSF